MQTTTIRVTAQTKRLLEALHSEGRKWDEGLTQQDLVDRALALAARHRDELFQDRPAVPAKDLLARMEAMSGPFGELSKNVDELVYGD